MTDMPEDPGNPDAIEMLKAMRSTSPEVLMVFADYIKQKFDAYVAAGFNSDQALLLTCWEMWAPRVQ